jgi:hypothetical protein
MKENIVNGIKTRVLHGKHYVEVAERIRIVHQVEDDFEQIETIHFKIEDRWFIRCVIRVAGKQYIGTAEIKFNAPKNTPDGSSPIECAETSALGRALAFAGLGTVDSIASYDEVARNKPFAQIAQSVTQVQETSEDDRRKARLNNLFKCGKAKGLFCGKEEMAEYISEIIGRDISANDIYGLLDEELSWAELAVAK